MLMPVLPPTDIQFPPSRGGTPIPIVRFEVPTAEQQRRRRQLEAMFVLGTGGSVQSQVWNDLFSAPSGAALTISTHPEDVPRARIVPGMMQDIKLFLIPQVKDMATVLGASRVTVYAWLQGTGVPKDEAFDRIRAVHELALYAKDKLSSSTEKARTEALRSSRLLELLGQSALPVAAVKRCIEGVAHQMQPRPLATARPEKVDLLAVAKRMGKSSRPSADARAYVDAITGKGYDPEVDDG